MSGMRLFLAVPIPQEVRKALYRVRQPLRDAWSGIRWVPDENYHITLAFYGCRDAAGVEEIGRAVPAALEGRADFPVELTGPDCFGDPRRPRIIYEGIGRGREELAALHACMKPPTEKGAYRPHLTLGRAGRGEVKGPDSGTDSGVEYRRVSVFSAAEVVLFLSESGPEGPVYSALEAWNLQS